MIKRLSLVCNANDLLIKKHSIQKRCLFMASENENVNIAEIPAGSPTRRNYKDILLSEGQLCGDCNFEVWYEYSVSEGGEHRL